MTLKNMVIPRETVCVDRGIPYATPEVVPVQADHSSILPETIIFLLFLLSLDCFHYLRFDNDHIQYTSPSKGLLE
jgi:hypothetical protein